MIEKQTVSNQNQKIVTAIKQNSILTKNYGPMYIYFDDYPQYTDEIYRMFETKLMPTLISVMDTPI